MKKTIFLLLFLISSANASSLPLIGLDSKGTPKEILISKKKWDSKLKESISILSESTLESLDKSKFRSEMKEKIRNEIRDGLAKDKILNEEDKLLLFNLYKKIKSEFQELENW